MATMSGYRKSTRNSAVAGASGSMPSLGAIMGPAPNYPSVQRSGMGNSVLSGGPNSSRRTEGRVESGMRRRGM